MLLFLAGKSPRERSYTVYIYTILANPTHVAVRMSWPTLHMQQCICSGQPYTCSSAYVLADPTHVAVRMSWPTLHV